MSHALHRDPQKRNIYLVQDIERPLWVVATSYTEALIRWEQNAARENDCAVWELDAPQGIQLVAEYDEVLI